MASSTTSNLADEQEQRAKRGRPRGSGTQKVYDDLRSKILRLQLKPGDHIDELQLEKRFKVSRTPIREALIRLQADGLAHFTPNRGHYVSLLEFSEIPRAFEALDLLQAAILQLVAERRTDEQLESLREMNSTYLSAAETGDHTTMTEANHRFHLITAEGSGNRFLSRAYESVLNFNLRITFLIFKTTSLDEESSRSYYTQIYDEHRQMIDLIRAGDAGALVELSRQHTNLFIGKIERFLQSNKKVPLNMRTFDDLSNSEGA